MEINTAEQRNQFEIIGNHAWVYLDETEVSRTNEDGEVEVSYNYQGTKVCLTDPRDSIVEQIIAIRYPSYGAELAAINNDGQDKKDYLAFRIEAKQIADEILA